MPDPKTAWLEVKGASLAFSNDARHRYAAVWREYNATLPPEVVENQTFVILGTNIALRLKEFPDAIEKDAQIAAKIAEQFSR